MAGCYERKLEIKYSVVMQICKAKHVLFAETCERVTKRDKMLRWQEIFEHSVSIGGINATRNWSYLRDVYWPNIKRSTMTKVHRQGILSRIDLTVLEILNLKMVVVKHGNKIKGEIRKLEQVLQERQTKDIPNMDDAASHDDSFLPIKQESVSFPNSPVPSSHHDDDYHLNKLDDEHLSATADNLEVAMDDPDPANNQCSQTDDGFKKINLVLNSSLSPHHPPLSPSPSPTAINMKDEISILRKRKLEEQVEYLRLQNVKARLEIQEAEIRVLMLQKDLELKNLQMAEKLK